MRLLLWASLAGANDWNVVGNVLSSFPHSTSLFLLLTTAARDKIKEYRWLKFCGERATCVEMEKDMGLGRPHDDAEMKCQARNPMNPSHDRNVAFLAEAT